MKDRDYRWLSPYHTRITSGWKTARMHIGKPLTDRKIERYEKAGRYGPRKAVIQKPS